MKTYTSFALFKNTRKQEGTKQPDYEVMARNEGDEVSTKIGSGWQKEYNNTHFYSVALNDENRTYQKKDGSAGEDKAYVIIEKDHYNDLMRIAGDATQTNPEKAGVDTSMMEDINPEDIPFN